MVKKTAHIISHSHWDREWYMSLEEHRYYLVKLFDDLLDTLKKDASFYSFHLDGQTIMVDDYLKVRPHKEEEVKKYIQEGRLVIGPWYILQDAFLTSSEANVRNLLYGMKETRVLGQEAVIGYFPDTFGIYGQAPQLMKQANIEVTAFGRGVTPTGFNNQVFHSDDYSSPYSEMIWEAPDGSSVLGILFANWYSNGNEVPIDAKEAKQFWNQKLGDASKFASTSQLLFMNGCDHQPLQKDITKAIERANELFTDVTFKHSNFYEYIEALKTELPKELQTIQGELRNQKTDGWSTLVNTASARIYLKQANDRCQILLEKVVEPLGLLTKDHAFHRDFVEYYWKLLMENHPHDSICGCSVDEVHREMVTRFEKVEKGALKFVEEQAREIATNIQTVHEHKSAIPLVILHTSGNSTSHVITKKVAIKKIYFDEVNFKDIPETLKADSLPFFQIELADKTTLPVSVKDLGVNFGYELPMDKFRKPYYAREIEVSFLLESPIQMGYEVCYLVPNNKQVKVDGEGKGIWNAQANKLENERLSVMIHEDGTYSIDDKQTNYQYRQLGVYEDIGDIGNEYMFKASGDGKKERTKGKATSIQVLEDNINRASIVIHSTLSVPIEADKQLETERANLVWHPERQSQRKEEKTELALETILTLERRATGLKVKVTIHNTAKDHRLRALFPVGEGNRDHYADSIFEIVKRPNQPEEMWSNPTFDQHMQRFVSLDDKKKGLTIATKGLHEYEIIENGTIAVTLLRSVGELGDWGVFETPEAQCLGRNEAEFMIIPHQGDVLSSNAYKTAYQYPLLPTVLQIEQNEGGQPPEKSLFEWTGEGLVLTTNKPSEDLKGTVLRWVNVLDTDQVLNLKMSEAQGIYRSTILEEKKERIAQNSVDLIIKAKEIITLFIEY
ncbi:alpha-mannosidase [Alkalihalobacillus sp. 1P02AB]|uniref:alpha-mannosidase n=1 Tax=Alkalihalobacillus sp. 1P02AB TaxID=3132260 RepID=UPI0039A599CF